MMLTFLKDIDTSLFLYLNGLHSSFWDTIMLFLSGKVEWIPFYIVLLLFIIYKFKWKSIPIFILIALLITMSDQGSVRLFKEMFHRLRPCHDPQIQNLVYIVNNYCGGKYGFISSHAANSFALIIFLSYLFKNRYITIVLLLWAIVVSYSRIYLGVHYLGDVIGGAGFGFLCGFIIYRLYLFLERKKFYLIFSKKV